MSKFYGTLLADDGKKSTRCGHHRMTAYAQSYDGSVGVTVTGSGAVTVSVYSGTYPGGGGKEITSWNGSINRLAAILEGLSPVESVTKEEEPCL